MTVTSPSTSCRKAFTPSPSPRPTIRSPLPIWRLTEEAPMPLLLSAFTNARSRSNAPTTWETDNVLNAWLDKGSPAKVESVPTVSDSAWQDPHRAAELVYDTRDQALPT